MDQNTFWRLVDSSRNGVGGADAQLKRLFAYVRELDASEILEFDRCFHESVRDAFRWDLWAAAYVINGGCSDDGFDYFIGWLIAQGRQYYGAAIADPERAGDRVASGDTVECESIWYIAARAYEDKTGTNDFYKNARPIRRELIGTPFDEEKVGTMYPRLAEKFGALGTDV